MTNKNLRKDVTQQHTFNIVRHALLNIHPNHVEPSPLHSFMGFTKLIVEWYVKGLRRLEEMEGENMQSEIPVQFKQSLATALNQATQYEQFLEEKLQDTIAAIEGQDKATDLFLERIARAEEVLTFEINPAERMRWEHHLNKLQEQQQQIEDESNGDSDEEDFKFLLMEQLCITKDAISELEVLLKKHEGHAKRVVISAMKDNGVDTQVYHKESIVGNHCMTFAARGDKITLDIKAKFMPLIQSQQNRISFSKFNDKLRHIISIWYDVAKFMKSSKLQTTEAISNFERDLHKLNKSIADFIETNPPIPDTGIKIPTATKTHYLFGDLMSGGSSHIIEFAKNWGGLGGKDEQNIESTHAVWNRLIRQFGTCRGVNMKRLVVNQFLFNNANFISGAIAQMVKGTSRNNSKNDKGEVGVEGYPAESEDAGEDNVGEDEIVDNDSNSLPAGGVHR